MFESFRVFGISNVPRVVLELTSRRVTLDSSAVFELYAFILRHNVLTRNFLTTLPNGQVMN